MEDMILSGELKVQYRVVERAKDDLNLNQSD